MFTLTAGETIGGVCSTSITVTYTIMGMERTVATGVEVFKVLAQGQLPQPAAAIYTVGAGLEGLPKTILLANTLGGTPTITLYVNGVAAANLIAGPITLPANGYATYGAAGWQVFDAAGQLLTAMAGYAASDTLAGVIEIAVQSEMEAGTDVVRAVTPGRQQFHPSACKGWGKAAGAGTLTTGYNMDACTDTGVGRLGVNITTDISSANYAIVSAVASVATTLTVATVDNGGLIYKDSQAAGAFGIWNYDDTATTHAAQDPQSYFWAIFGDFA